MKFCPGPTSVSLQQPSFTYQPPNSICLAQKSDISSWRFTNRNSRFVSIRMNDSSKQFTKIHNSNRLISLDNYI